MPQGYDNVRHVYPSPGVMCVVLVNPVLQTHVETVRRRFAEAKWTIDARIDPENHAIIVVRYESGMWQYDLQQKSSALTKKIRDKPPATVEPLGPGSLARTTCTPLPPTVRTTDMPPMAFRQVGPDSETSEPVLGPEAVLRLAGVNQPLLIDLVMTALVHGYPVDVTADGVSVRINPK